MDKKTRRVTTTWFLYAFFFLTALAACGGGNETPALITPAPTPAQTGESLTVTTGSSTATLEMTVIVYQDVANPTTVQGSLIARGSLLVNSDILKLTSLTAPNPGPNYQVYLYYPTGESCSPIGLVADPNCFTNGLSGPIGLSNTGTSTVGACGGAAPESTITVSCSP